LDKNARIPTTMLCSNKKKKTGGKSPVMNTRPDEVRRVRARSWQNQKEASQVVTDGSQRQKEEEK